LADDVKTSRWVTQLVLSLVLAPGCSDRLVDGAFLGDSTIRLHGELGAHLPDPYAPVVGAIWLGYAGLSEPTEGVETTALPITALRFPGTFICDVLDPPPSSGRYQLPTGGIVPAAIRIARLVIFDDRDGDVAFQLDATGAVMPPDRLLAQAEEQLLLFVQHGPLDPGALDAAGAILTNWEEAFPGYHVVTIDPAVAPPSLLGQVVDNATAVTFVPPHAGGSL